MHPGRFRILLSVALIIAGSVFSEGQTTQQSSPVDISFTVSMTKPHTHLLEVDARIKREANAPATYGRVARNAGLDARIPISCESTNVTSRTSLPKTLRASRSNGKKINKDTWRVVTNGSHDWHASYRVLFFFFFFSSFLFFFFHFFRRFFLISFLFFFFFLFGFFFSFYFFFSLSFFLLLFYLFFIFSFLMPKQPPMNFR